MALVDAIQSFAESGSDDFDGYARGQVERQLDGALEDERSSVREAEQLLEDARAYERAEISVRKLTGRAPTDAELARKLEWPVERTRLLGEMVGEARRRHDEELLQYLDPESLDEDEEEEEDG
jgi:DNA-directed RNA polymerase specialized sigma subunit